MTGQMAKLINAYDWAATPLGPWSYWPVSLRTAVELMLSARQPVYIGWGPQLVSLYNDACIPIMGTKHPDALGKPYSSVFAEIWAEYQPLLRATLEGEVQHFIDQPVALLGRPEPVSWFTFSWTPLRDNEGTIRGFYCAATETTEKIRAQELQRQQAAQFQTVVDQAPIGIYLIDADFRVRHANPVATPTFAGIPNFIGRDFTDILHVLWNPSFAAEMADVFRAVLATGVPLIEPERAERRADLDVVEYYSYRIDRIVMPDGRFGVVCYFRNVTKEVRARHGLAESKDRQDFLLQLSDALRPLQDANAIITAAARLIGTRLAATRSFYYEYDEIGGLGEVHRDYFAPGEESIAGRHQERLSDTLLSAARRGRVFAASNVDEDSLFSPDERVALRQANIRSIASSPLVKGGRFVASCNVASATPRTWTAAELFLLQESADRTWAAVERARVLDALRRSEEHYRASVQLNPQITWTASADGVITSLSPRWTELTGLPIAPRVNDSWAQAMHTDDAARIAAEWQASVACGRPFDCEMRIMTRVGAYHWVRGRAFPQRDAGGCVIQWFGTLDDVEDLRTASVALKESEHRLQTLIEGVPQLVWRAVDHGLWTWSSRQWTEFTGQAASESHLHGWLNAVHPDDRPGALSAWSAAVADATFDAEFRLLHAAERRYRWFQSRAAPVRDEHGAVIEWLGTSTDVDDQRQLQARQEVLVAELQHRTRNLMAVVRSVADRTLRGSTSMGDFEERFRERLAALSRVQGLLSRLREGGRIMFDELLRSELAALGADDERGSRVSLRGPSGVALRSSTVQTFAMALHELATNSAKYGALRQPRGKLDIQWRIEQVLHDKQPWLYVDWRERQVDMPSGDGMPQGTGHGRELIERALPYQLGARTSFSMEADGIHCSIALPISRRSGVDELGAS